MWHSSGRVEKLGPMGLCRIRCLLNVMVLCYSMRLFIAIIISHDLTIAVMTTMIVQMAIAVTISVKAN